MSNERSISVSRVIPAQPAAIFAVLTSPAGHAAIDGSGQVKAPQDGQPERLEMGTKFGMKMKQGMPYRVSNTVVEFETDRRIGWRHFGGHVWRYELEPADEGTKVTETFDWSTSKSPWFLTLMKIPEKHHGNMTRTLERLEAHVTGD